MLKKSITILLVCFGVNSATAQNDILLKDYKPESIYRIPKTTIEKAKFPLLVIGAGANRKQTAKMLAEFVDKTGIYFVNTQMGKGVIDERHEKFLGTAALSENDYVHCALDKADRIINVGPGSPPL